MRKISQDIQAPPHGNCFQACLASILELHLDLVPNFVGDHGDDWFPKLREWLAPMNLGALFLEALDEQAPQGYSILSIEKESGTNHCLVALDGEVVWDPGSGQGIVAEDAYRYWTILTVLDPTKPCGTIPSHIGESRDTIGC